MRNMIIDALKGHHADYIEAHFGESENTQLTYHGAKLDEVNRVHSCGGNIRALINGGWGFVSFNNLDNLKEKIALAVSEGRWTSNERLSCSHSQGIVDTVDFQKGKEATSITLQEKKQLLDEYNDIMLSCPRVQSTIIRYEDTRRKDIFASSEGSYIEQSKPDLSLRLTAIARKNDEVQQAGLSLGSRGDFSVIEGLHHQVKKISDQANALLDATHIKGGEFTVILDPVLAGVFTHEAFGHLSEADFIYQNNKLRDIMTLGRRFGGKHLNIIDDASIHDLRGSYKYDDEGTPAAKIPLIQEGILVGRLHSLETAARMKEKPTGNARAINYRFPPIVRMSNTFISSGKASFKDMISDIKEGIYVKNWYGGTTSLEMFTFSSGEAYMIRNGELAELLRPVVLTGNVFTTLGNIDMIGNDLEMNQGGGCGKGAQSPLPVSNGSPHIRIRHCIVGGR
jgi:TldD protein